jgi:hypothetical protein
LLSSAGALGWVASVSAKSMSVSVNSASIASTDSVSDEPLMLVNRLDDLLAGSHDGLNILVENELQ